MEMNRVSSRTIYSIGFDKQSSTLQIRFWSGFTYQYFGVPVSVYESFKLATSKGRFYNQHIRGNRYLGRRVS